MVEQTLKLDSVFGSLADPTRRDILKRVSKKDLTISEIAKPYRMSFAAIAKHVAVLQKSLLIIKRRHGKEQVISASPDAIKFAASHLEGYAKIWQERYDRLESLLTKQGE